MFEKQRKGQRYPDGSYEYSILHRTKERFEGSRMERGLMLNPIR